MNANIANQLAALQKSTDNLLGATNPAARAAHRKFLIQRAQPLNDEQQRLAAWLDTADTWLTDNMPEINTDAAHERNQKWLQKLGDYEVINAALNTAWDALMQESEVNAA